jgi:hypothetical protein
MSEPKVTIGVPVYNGAAYLDECLQNLADQTFQDFIVLVYDNASTDETQEIGMRWAAKDPRFSYVRQPFNKGATQNFLDVLDAARSDWFMWRAHDDLGEPNLLEELVRLTESSNIDLAASRILMKRTDGSKQRVTPAPNMGNPKSLRDIARRLLRSHQSWFYGLWRRETLILEFGEAWAAFPHGWGSDHLTLYPLLVDGRVGVTNTTTFIQRIKSAAPGARRPPPPLASHMADLRRTFLDRCNLLTDARKLPALKHLGLRLLNIIYAGKRVYSLRRIAGRRLAELFSGVSQAR